VQPRSTARCTAASAKRACLRELARSSRWRGARCVGQGVKACKGASPLPPLPRPLQDTASLCIALPAHLPFLPPSCQLITHDSTPLSQHLTQVRDTRQGPGVEARGKGSKLEAT
jgi:hypothetical protein